MYTSCVFHMCPKQVIRQQNFSYCCMQIEKHGTSLKSILFLYVQHATKTISILPIYFILVARDTRDFSLPCHSIISSTNNSCWIRSRKRTLIGSDLGLRECLFTKFKLTSSICQKINKTSYNKRNHKFYLQGELF